MQPSLTYYDMVLTARNGVGQHKQRFDESVKPPHRSNAGTEIMFKISLKKSVDMTIKW